eukprot:11469588-Alexandrium_andersonii.AAC.1
MGAGHLCDHRSGCRRLRGICRGARACATIRRSPRLCDFGRGARTCATSVGARCIPVRLRSG